MLFRFYRLAAIQASYLPIKLYALLRHAMVLHQGLFGTSASLSLDLRINEVIN